MIKNYYKILGVEYNATDDEIKSAYRRLAKKYHPDLNQGDADAAAKFRNVNEAGEALLDAQTRTEHDYLLESKGIHTGRFDKPEPQPEPEESVEGEKEEKPKKPPPPPPPKKPLTRAEKAAAAMEKVRESRKVTRRAIIIGAVSAACIILTVVVGVLIWQFGGKKVTLTIEYGNGEPAKIEKLDVGETIARPLPPVWENHEFLDWYIDAECTVRAVFPLTLTEDTVLYADWNAIVQEEMQVTLKFGNGQPDRVVTVYVGGWEWRGTEIEDYSPPVRMGYKFAGWYALDRTDDEASLMIPASVSGDMQKAWSLDIPYITAKWMAVRVTITLTWDDGEGGEGTYISQVEYGEKVALGYPPIGFRDGFIGWYDASKGELVTDDKGTMLNPSEYTQNVTLFARYEEEEE